MSMSTNEDYHERKKENILNAAGKLFSHYGYQKTTTGDIAGEVGLVKGALYSYFPSKEELFVAVIEKEMNSLLGEIKKFKDPCLPSLENLKRMITISIEFVRENKYMQMLLKKQHPQNSRLFNRVMQRFEEEMVEMLEVIIIQGVKDGAIKTKNARLTAYAIIKQFKALLILGFKENEQFSKEEIISTILEMICRGLSPLSDFPKKHKSPDWWMKSRSGDRL